MPGIASLPSGFIGASQKFCLSHEKRSNPMRKLSFPLIALFLALLSLPGLIPPVQAASQPIYGLWFSQPPTDNVKIVYLNHQEDNVTDEAFGTSYTDAARSGCLRYVQTLYLARYRGDPTGGWTVLCYSDPQTYVSVKGAVFGQ